MDNHQNLPDDSDHDLHDGSCGGRHSTEVEESVQRDSWVDKIDDILRVAEVDGELRDTPGPITLRLLPKALRLVGGAAGGGALYQYFQSPTFLP